MYAILNTDSSIKTLFQRRQEGFETIKLEEDDPRVGKFLNRNQSSMEASAILRIANATKLDLCNTLSGDSCHQAINAHVRGLDNNKNYDELRDIANAHGMSVLTLKDLANQTHRAIIDVGLAYERLATDLKGANVVRAKEKFYDTILAIANACKVNAPRNLTYFRS